MCTERLDYSFGRIILRTDEIYKRLVPQFLLETCYELVVTLYLVEHTASIKLYASGSILLKGEVCICCLLVRMLHLVIQERILLSLP
jgi:hypothetical protein